MQIIDIEEQKQIIPLSRFRRILLCAGLFSCIIVIPITYIGVISYKNNNYTTTFPTTNTNKYFSFKPSYEPTNKPTNEPSYEPSYEPSNEPSINSHVF